jgi:hypothetical protein
MLTLLLVLATQTGRTAITDTIAGMVTGPGGRPLAGAIVQATSAVTRLSRWQTSDGAGRFTIYFPGRAQYQLTVYYFGLVRGPGVVPLWARDDRRAASIRLDLAGFANPIDTILGRYGVLGLTGDQITRLREVAASTNSFALPELERVRNILTASQWSRLSTESLSAVTIRTQASSASPSPPPSAPASSSQRPVRVTRPDVTLYTGVSTVYETNLTHAPAGLDSYGVLLGVGGDFRYRSRHTTLEAQYDGVFRRYTGTDLWNVPGHEASVAVSHRVARRWAVGAEAGIQLNGSSEDRVLRNEYTAEAILEYRLTGASRVELYSVYMLKRYPNPSGNNASDPRVGLKYRRVLGASGTWGVGGRYDYNGADSSRYRYNAYTATSDVGFPVGGSGRISSSLRYNIRRYVSRLITVDAGKELRRDADFVATLAWRQGIARVWDVVASYRYEYYRSNDPDHTFRDDMVAVALTRYW